MLYENGWTALKNYSRRFSDPGKDYPKELRIRTTDGAFIVLERVWFKGEWRYMVKGEITYKFASPEEDYKRMKLAETTPQALRE